MEKSAARSGSRPKPNSPSCSTKGSFKRDGSTGPEHTKLLTRPLWKPVAQSPHLWRIVIASHSSAVASKNAVLLDFAVSSQSEHDRRRIAIAFLFVCVLCDCFKSRRRLEAEILVLRHQLNVVQQRAPRRLHLRWVDRALFIWLYRRYPRILDAITIVRPETVVRWHRMGFAAYWRWKSRPRGWPTTDRQRGA